MSGYAKTIPEYQREVADLQRRLRQAQGELLVAKRNAESWQETAQQAQARAEAAEGKWDWFVSPAYRHVLNLMCQTYSDGKQDVREMKGQLEAAEALVAAYRKADMKLALDTHNAAAMEMNEDILEHPAEAQARSQKKPNVV